MGKAAGRGNAVGRIGGLVGGSLVLIGAAMLIIPRVNPSLVSSAGVVVDERTLVTGLPLLAIGVALAAVATALGWRMHRGGAAGARSKRPDGGEPAGPAPDLNAAPEAVRNMVTAARQLGYDVAAVAGRPDALVVRMKSPLEPEDRDILSRRFPTLGRWYFSGSADRLADEGFRDDASGAAVSFPVLVANPGTSGSSA